MNLTSENKNIRGGLPESDDNPIYVNQPSLPDLNDFLPYLEKIWQSKRLTNFGEFHQELELKLSEFLGVEYVSLFSNGTLALMAALQVLRISGEVITTPFSFVATTHALHWNGIKPVFCDIEEATCNLDATKIEQLITPKTSAILPVHIYGNPCNVKKIEEIADIYGLQVIYDAAHAFGVKLNGESILNFGDLSVLSFHATKIYNTFEGGAVITNDPKIRKRLDYLKNFGFANETTVVAPGINAKMNEMQAALGLLQLNDVNKNIDKRRIIAEKFQKAFTNIEGIRILNYDSNIDYNYGYFPIFIDDEVFRKTRDQVYFELKEKNIFTRRYFYPLISQFPTYRGLKSADSENLSVAEEITRRVICLPIYADLDKGNIQRIIDIILG